MPAEQPNSEPVNYNLEFFFELSPDLMCIAGFDGYFKKVNASLINTLGFSENELFAKPIQEFIHPDDRDITQRKRKDLLNSSILTQFENRYISKDGGAVWLQWSSIALKNQQVVYAVAKDITLKKAVELERNELLKSLSESNKDLKFFNYSSSHDLRSPLSNLMALHQLLDDIEIENDELAEYIGLLKLATENLNQVISSYMDGWIKKDRLSTEIKKVSFESILSETKKSIQQLLLQDSVTIKTDFEDAPEVIFAPNYLQSIFLNLITNSIKYAKPEEAPIIEIKSQKKKNQIELIYKDNGIGIDMEQASDRIFNLHQRFQKPSENRKGKGIGLYLVHNQLTSLGGSIDVFSKIDKGTTFKITFKNYE